MSSKGQIVTPSKIRKKLNIHKGSVFAISSEREMIILKKVKARITDEDMRALKLAEVAWADIAKGMYKSRSKEAFFNELKEW